MMTRQDMMQAGSIAAALSSPAVAADIHSELVDLIDEVSDCQYALQVANDAADRAEGQLKGWKARNREPDRETQAQEYAVWLQAKNKFCRRIKWSKAFSDHTAAHMALRTACEEVSKYDCRNLAEIRLKALAAIQLDDPNCTIAQSIAYDLVNLLAPSGEQQSERGA